MKISHILDAISLDTLDPRRFEQQVIDKWRAIRFGSQTADFINSDTIGAVLIKSSNFAELQSGWLDTTEVTLPIDLVPRTFENILSQLKWMIDCRRNEDTIKLIWKMFVRALKSNDRSHGHLPRFSVDYVAEKLTSLLATNEPLAIALLSGRLGRACEILKETKNTTIRTIDGHIVLLMIILWALMDVQIIAYRLHHAAWNPLDAGTDSPENATLAALIH